MVASIWVAGRHNGTSEEHCGASVRSCVASYRHELRRLADLPLFTRSFERLDVDRLTAKTAGPLQEQVVRSAERARHRTGDRALPRFTHEVDGLRKIVEEPPLITRPEPREAELLADALDGYLETLPSYWRRVLGGYTLVDVAHKVVGVGSVGLRAYVALLEGSSDEDVVFLQLKSRPADRCSRATCMAIRPGTLIRASGSSSTNSRCRPSATRYWAGPRWTGCSITCGSSGT